jgi:acetyl-CoA carboxylase carboxyl transferase subunit beta
MKKEIEEDIESILSGSGEPHQSEVSKSRWFTRKRKGILTSTADKKETPEGLWNKCPECSLICTTNELKENLFICPKCNHHHRIGSEEYYEQLFDNHTYTELFENILSKDQLGFTDLKPYKKRLSI